MVYCCALNSVDRWKLWEILIDDRLPLFATIILYCLSSRLGLFATSLTHCIVCTRYNSTEII